MHSTSPAPNQFQAVFFDLDGTLIDTEPVAALAVQSCFDAWGVALDPKDAQFITGRTWDSAFDHLFAKYPLPVPRETAATEMIETYRRKVHENLVVVPGSVDAVRGLAEKYPLALVSGSWRKEILWALGELKILEHFKVILGAEDYPASKPAPDGYLHALRAVGAEGKRTLIFEDSTAGITSGRAAGAWVVAVTRTNHFQQDVSLAHERIHDLETVSTEWVKTLERKFLE